MRLFRYWTPATVVVPGERGQIEVTAYGYSNTDLDDALRVARERAEATASWIHAGKPRGFGYYGGDRPLREEIVEEVEVRGRQIAAITRNSYGSLVLNTEDVFFADVDLPKRSLRRLFRRSGGFEQELVSRIESVVSADPSLRLRLYRTTSGFRILLMSRRIPATEARSAELLAALGSDELYVALCKTQDSYRARLTPKPWRIGVRRPPGRFPFRSAEHEQAYRAWERDYDAAASRFATCALVADFGSASPDAAAREIARIHDRYALNGDLPLG